MHACCQSKNWNFFCHWKFWWGFWLDCFMSKTIINLEEKSPSKKLDSFWHYSKWWPQVLNLFFLLHSSFPKHETFRYAFMVFFLWTQSILKSKPTAADSKNGHINSGKLWNAEQGQSKPVLHLFYSSFYHTIKTKLIIFRDSELLLIKTKIPSALLQI